MGVMTTLEEAQIRVRIAYGDSKTSLAEYIGITESVRALNKKEFPFYFRTFRAAFLSSYTIQGLAEIYCARGIFHNLMVNTYTAPYNQFTQIILSPESEFYQFNPQVVYLLIDTPDILNEAHVNELVDTLLLRTTSHVIVSSFFSSHDHAVRADQLNQNLKERFEGHKRVAIFDIKAFLDHIGLERYWYTKYKELGDFRIAPAAFPAFAESLLAYAVAVAGNTKKCVVVDLDNTLWQGVVGEEGQGGICPDLRIQQYLLNLFEKGVVLAINSKNNVEDALEAIESHPDMLLRKKHFAAWRINWENKDKNIAALAEELNLGTESFVFVDDDPFQRELVSSTFPEIAVLAPDKLFDYSGFYSFVVTDEDRRRGAMYTEERQRVEFKKSLRTEEDFLRELAMQIDIRDVSEDRIARVSQLTQKTNQFNLTTRRYSEDEVGERMHQGWKVWTISVIDRFGDYGIVGVVMIEPKDNQWRIDTLLLSCRILGRRVEEHIVKDIKEKAKDAKVHLIKAEYIPTAKNKQAERFFDEMGFQAKEGIDDKIKQYYLHSI